jgi:hypothetical protein
MRILSGFGIAMLKVAGVDVSKGVEEASEEAAERSPAALLLIGQSPPHQLSLQQRYSV